MYDQDKLQRFLGYFGKIDHINKPKRPTSPQSYVFIYFTEIESAQRCLEYTDIV